jgi:hypothetical protein
MADPFTPDTPNLGSGEADSRDAGRRQDSTGAKPEDRSFREQEGAGGGLSQQELDAQADTSRDKHQTPRGNDAVRDTDDNLGQ